MRLISMIVLICFLTACTQAIPKESLKTADPDLTFQKLIKEPEQYRGRIILTGGQILGTTAREGETWVEVLQKPLDWQQKPKDTDESFGRFLIRFESFADPAIYAVGKKITVLGEVLGKKVQPLKEMDYAYPVLTPREHYLWKPEDSSSPSFHFGIGVGVGVYK
jgi:outer membrane lipoprotein